MVIPKDWKVFDISPGVCYTEPGDSMYNQEIKERFLSESMKNIRFSLEGFRKAEPIETKTGKDIAEMTREESLEVIREIGVSEYSSLRATITAFKNYVNWCQNNRVFKTIPGGFTELKPSDVGLSEELKYTLFKDEEDFLSALKSVREFDQGYPEPPVLCLVWSGLKAKEIIALKDNDVNMETQTVTVDGGIAVSGFSKAVAEVLQQYIDCKVAERDHYTGWRQVIKDYSTDFFLKRMLPRGNKDFGKPFGSSQISSAINKLNKKLEDDGNPARLKPDNVWNSGRYYAMWQAEQSGIDVTKPGNRQIVEDIFRHSKGYYSAIHMYKAYKEAFGLD